MKKALIFFTALIFIVSPQLYSQVTLQVGGGLGYIAPAGDYSGSTVDFYNGTKYGMSSGLNYHAKARVGLLGLNLFGIIEYSTISGDGESEPGQGKVENSHSIFSLKAGPEFNFSVPLSPIGFYLDGFVSVNKHFETAAKGVFAVGDAIGQHLSAHHALATGLSLIDHLTGKEVSYNERQIPFCVYTKPGIACLGMTQEEAEKKQEILVGKFPFAGAGMAQCVGEEDGIVKIVVDKKYGEILGVHILGPQATELISLASIAMKNELPVEMLGSVIFPHPSLSETVGEAVWDLKNEAIHSLKNW